MLDEIKVNSLRDLALGHLPKTVALREKLYLEHHDSRAALQVVATAPTLLINSPLSTTVEKLAGRLLHLVGEHPDTHTESLIDRTVGDKAFGITLKDAIRYAEQKRAPIEAALIETAHSLCEMSGATLPPWMNSHKEQSPPEQSPGLLLPLTIENASDAIAKQSNTMKLDALIAELEFEWPLIKAHIKEASRNGLKDAAHTGKSGYW